MTPQQAEILEFVEDCSENGSPPVIDEISVAIGESRRTVIQYVRYLVSGGYVERNGTQVRPMIYFTPEEDETLISMIEKGESVGVIGKALGRSIASVDARARRLGLTVKNRKHTRSSRSTFGQGEIAYLPPTLREREIAKLYDREYDDMRLRG